MRARMEKYDTSNNEVKKRTSRNERLYNEVQNMNIDYVDINVNNAMDLSVSSNDSSREGYQKRRELDNLMPSSRERAVYQESTVSPSENRVYDINRVLEDAHKNRTVNDGKEEKRKLKDESYNILTSLSKEELEKYREKKQNRYIHPDEDELKTLINTISSKTLATDLENLTNSNLFSDLMATNVMDQVPSLKSEPEEDAPNEALNKDDLAAIQEAIPELEKAAKEKEAEQEKEKLTGADTEFYTKSMDLSDQDFDGDEFMKEKGMSPVLKVFLILLLLAALATAGYFIWKTFS